MGGRTDPASCPAALQRTACCPFPCATCPLPSVLGRAADSQCPHSYPEPTSDHVVRRSWPLCRFPRPFDGVSAPPRHQYACSSDQPAAPCGSSCPRCLSVPWFCSSVARFASSPAGTPTSQEHWVTLDCLSPQTSGALFAATSLRIAWVEPYLRHFLLLTHISPFWRIYESNNTCRWRS